MAARPGPSPSWTRPTTRPWAAPSRSPGSTPTSAARPARRPPGTDPDIGAFELGGSPALIEIVGTSRKDFLKGTDADEIIRGLAGDDTVSGGGGADFLHGSTGNDQLFGEGGDDQLFGGSGRDQLFGGEGNDQLFGDGGNDRLNGGVGQDTLRGGPGGDRYDIDAAAESGPGAAVRDLVLNFSHKGGDRIDLAGVDADALLGGDQAFSFLGTGAFGADASGQLRAEDLGTTVVLQGSTDADTAPELEIEVRDFDGVFVAGDFVL